MINKHVLTWLVTQLIGYWEQTASCSYTNISYWCNVTHAFFKTCYQPFSKNHLPKAFMTKNHYERDQKLAETCHKKITHHAKHYTFNLITPPKPVTKNFNILVTKKSKKNQLSHVKETKKNKKTTNTYTKSKVLQLSFQYIVNWKYYNNLT